MAWAQPALNGVAMAETRSFQEAFDMIADMDAEAAAQKKARKALKTMRQVATEKANAEAKTAMEALEIAIKSKEETIKSKEETVEMSKKTVEMSKKTVEMSKKTVEMSKKTVEMSKKTVEMSKKAMMLLEEKNQNLVFSLSRHRAVFATRPLLEHGLREYGNSIHWGYATASDLYKNFANTELFQHKRKSDSLKRWAHNSLKQANQHLELEISHTTEFTTCLRTLYKKLSEEHHGVVGTEEGQGFVIDGRNPMVKGAATLMVCKLRKKGFLHNMKIVVASVDGQRRYGITQQGDLEPCDGT